MTFRDRYTKQALDEVAYMLGLWCTNRMNGVPVDFTTAHKALGTADVQLFVPCGPYDAYAIPDHKRAAKALDWKNEANENKTFGRLDGEPVDLTGAA